MSNNNKKIAQEARRKRYRSRPEQRRRIRVPVACNSPAPEAGAGRAGGGTGGQEAAREQQLLQQKREQREQLLPPPLPLPQPMVTWSGAELALELSACPMWTSEEDDAGEVIDDELQWLMMEEHLAAEAPRSRTPPPSDPESSPLCLPACYLVL